MTVQDPYWHAVVEYLRASLRTGEEILAPREFLEVFPSSYDYRAAYALEPERFQFVVIGKGYLSELDGDQLRQFRSRLEPVFANEVFVVLGPAGRRRPFDVAHLRALEVQLPQATRRHRAARCAVLVTTHDRPDALKRSLPQIARLGLETLVVDDSSSSPAAERIAELCRANGARRLRIEENRGLPTALNAGISYWLADPGIEWISCFQDDVEVRADAMQVLARVQDERARPLLTGRRDLDHREYGSETIDGLAVLRLRSAPGVHLHGHRDYWRGVLPIPTPYLGAPKPNRGLPGQGADEDFWVTCWSPQSIVKRGGFVICVPGLVRTFASHPSESTWSDRGLPAPDPPLALPT